MLSKLDRFLCSMELVERFLLADMHSLPRPLSHYTSQVWTANEGNNRPMYIKLDRLWLREAGFEEAGKARRTHTQVGSIIGSLATKIRGLWQHLMEFQKHIWTERNKRKIELLTQIKHIDEVEYVWPIAE